MNTAPSFLVAVSLASSTNIATRVDSLFWSLIVLFAFVAAIIGTLTLIFLIRYRKGSRAYRGPVRVPTWIIETSWITATTLVFLGIFVWAERLYLDMERLPANAYVIDVVGRQWMWDIRHPNGRREFNTLHVPLNQPVILRLTSEDVIHSVFIPAFRLKQDVVPGKTVSTWFEATRAGTYHLFCSQFCGTAHAAMTAEVIAQSPEDYAAWLSSAEAQGEPVARGRRLLLRYGCASCHSVGSPVRAPLLEGRYGQLVPVEGGRTVRVDDVYLRDSILEPGKEIAAGYQPLMPSFKGVIPESDLIELIAYIKSLTPPPDRP